MSETASRRAVLAPFCVGVGLDIGFGGDPIVPTAICVDRRVGLENPTHVQYDAAHLKHFADGSLDYVYSSHALEDFKNTAATLREWMRVIKDGGHLVLLLPDQAAYVAHCERNNSIPNAAHIHAHFSLAYVKECLRKIGIKDEQIVMENWPTHEGSYSFELVVRADRQHLYSIDAIIILNEGEFPGLQWCQESLSARSPGLPIHIIGDSYPSAMADEFASVYEHHNVNDRGYVIRNHVRWMKMLDFARANGYRSFFSCDRDVLAFDNVGLSRYPTPIAGWAHTTWVYDLDVLEEMCRFRLEFFKSKDAPIWKRCIRQYKHQCAHGGLGDMFMFDLWSNSKWGSTIQRACFLENKGAMYDMDICNTAGLLADGFRKRITFDRGHPYCTAMNGGSVRMQSLHCWGPYKEQMDTIWKMAVLSENTEPIRFTL